MYPYTNIWDHCEEMALRNGLHFAPRIDKASYDRWAGYR